MAWQGILGHDSVMEKFRRAAQRGRLSGSFLFIGPAGVGKKMFTIALAKTLLCKNRNEEQWVPCGSCPSCVLFPEHPDFYTVSKPDDKTFIPLELFIGAKERRGREGLCYEISRTPYMGNRKIAMIDDADYMNQEGANSLLKTLEEPPPDSLLILLGTSATKQLPTIRSRCQIVRFAPLSGQNLATILHKIGAVNTLEQGMRIAGQGGNGGIEQALDWNDESLDSFRENLNRVLSLASPDYVKLASMVNGFVESVGKEPQAKRKRLRMVFAMALGHDRLQLEKTAFSDAEKARLYIRRIEQTLDAMWQIDRNFNLPLIIGHWARNP